MWICEDCWHTFEQPAHYSAAGLQFGGCPSCGSADISPFHGEPQGEDDNQDDDQDDDYLRAGTLVPSEQLKKLQEERNDFELVCETVREVLLTDWSDEVKIRRALLAFDTVLGAGTSSKER